MSVRQTVSTYVLRISARTAYLGGSLKYEQYFGRGVSVSDSTSPDTLKDNPAVLTAGLSYTPFP